MGINNSIVLNMDSIYLSKIRVSVDKILLDVPCTGEGLIRQDVSRKKSKKMRDLEKMASIQKKLLIAGLNALKKGDKLLYCACSIAPEENELVLNDVLHDKSDFSIERINNQYGINGYTHICGVPLLEDLKFSQRLYPHLHDTIGFFFCLIQRKNRGLS